MRDYYAAFESGLKASAADVYIHEIPGGQYSNLRPQAESMNLGDRLPELKRMYAVVNEMLGDIVKVTPSSKIVGDLALFMLTNNLTPQEVLDRGMELTFPESVIGYFAGEIGQPPGGFPKRLQEVVLKGRKPVDGRPGDTLPPADLVTVRGEVERKIGREASESEVLSYLMYPKVFVGYAEHLKQFGDVSMVPTDVFFYGLRQGEETEVEIERGKTLFVKLVAIGEPDEEGRRTVFYELNGHPREVKVLDRSLGIEVKTRLEGRRRQPAPPRVSHARHGGRGEGEAGTARHRAREAGGPRSHEDGDDPLQPPHRRREGGLREAQGEGRQRRPSRGLPVE